MVSEASCGCLFFQCGDGFGACGAVHTPQMGVLASSLDHAHQIQLAFHLVAGLVTKSFWKPMAFPLHLEKVIDMLRDSDCLSPDDASDGWCMAATLTF